VISPSWGLAAFAALGVLSMLLPRFIKKLGGIPLVLGLSLALSIVAVSLSGRAFGHYYMQVVPVYVLCGALGLRLLSGFNRLAPLLLLAAVILIDYPYLRASYERLLAPYELPPQSTQLAKFIADNTSPQDRIWIPSSVESDTHLYLAAQRLPATRYFYAYRHTFLDTYLTSAFQKKMEIKEALINNPPKIIVIDDPGRDLDFMADTGLPEWIEKSYEPVAVGTRTIMRLRPSSPLP
ncbi:MAG: hypothetical protein DCC75_10190, partial [Proteobacteria bacterium]